MIKLLAKPVAETIHAQVKNRVTQFIQKHRRPPMLSVVLVGEDPASVIYTRRKGEVAASLGIAHQTLHLPKSSTPEEVKLVIDRLNKSPKVDGILIQRPLPSDFIEEDVLYWITPEKDVDAFHPVNAGRLFLGLPAFQPCTPAGIMALLQYYKIETRGKIACVIGRSPIVGKPMAALLLQANATVLHCHSQTPDLKSITQQAEILVVAAGKMNLIHQSHVRQNSVVVDVGMHRNSEGKVTGDVLFSEVSKVASAITPVPGGVGPMTIAILMQNTILAAELRMSE